MKRITNREEQTTEQYPSFGGRKQEKRVAGQQRGTSHCRRNREILRAGSLGGEKAKSKCEEHGATSGVQPRGGVGVVEGGKKN